MSPSSVKVVVTVGVTITLLVVAPGKLLTGCHVKDVRPDAESVVVAPEHKAAGVAAIE